MAAVLDPQAEAAREMIAKIVADGVATINGNDYTFTPMVHKQRRRVFAYFSHVGPEVSRSDFSFLASPEFEAIERVIQDSVLFDGMQLSKLPDHWDTHAADYVNFIAVALQVISYPFMAAAPTS